MNILEEFWYSNITNATLGDFALHFHIRAENNVVYAIIPTLI